MINWPAFLLALAKFFGPIIFEWLRKLFEQVQAEFLKSKKAFPESAHLAVHDAFAAARAKLWAWQFGKRAALRACERVALGRAAELHQAAKGVGAVPVMTGAEYDEASAPL